VQLDVDPLLLVDDDAGSLKTVELCLKREFALVAVTDAHEAERLLQEKSFSVVITDQRMPEKTGVELLEVALLHQPDAERILITAYSDIDDLVDAVNRGHISRYVAKPWKPADLRMIVAQAVDTFRLRRENRRLTHVLEERNAELEVQSAQIAREAEALREEVRGLYHFEGMVSKSPEMRGLFETLRKVAPYNVTVLLCGESGVGKELAAKALHYNSDRADRPFVAINCGAIPSEIIESELFGNKKGAYTGAQADRKGLFREADQGTLFLDEIGEMSLPAQAKLLRVIQERVVVPVGGHEGIAVDVRIIAATNRELKKLAREGKFRDDLYQRVNVIQVTLPPLRKRPEDIDVLVETFLQKLEKRHGIRSKGLTKPAVQKLHAHHWPGNVRELENVLERAVILAGGRTLDAADLHIEQTGEAGGDDVLGDLSLRKAVDGLKRRYITEAVTRCKGNKARASRLLQLDRSVLYKEMSRLGLDM
jgi:two-component system, NtrC family, response regulator HupR/HoxA